MTALQRIVLGKFLEVSLKSVAELCSLAEKRTHAKLAFRTLSQDSRERTRLKRFVVFSGDLQTPRADRQRQWTGSFDRRSAVISERMRLYGEVVKKYASQERTARGTTVSLPCGDRTTVRWLIHFLVVNRSMAFPIASPIK